MEDSSSVSEPTTSSSVELPVSLETESSPTAKKQQRSKDGPRHALNFPELATGGRGRERERERERERLCTTPIHGKGIRFPFLDINH
jgi:hypothetical protein